MGECGGAAKLLGKSHQPTNTQIVKDACIHPNWMLGEKLHACMMLQQRHRESPCVRVCVKKGRNQPACMMAEIFFFDRLIAFSCEEERKTLHDAAIVCLLLISSWKKSPTLTCVPERGGVIFIISVQILGRDEKRILRGGVLQIMFPLL